ncbi:hypothetical protein F5Y06DRAFT_277344 [Hypoxylon sp. FL0890]|nr:hypothetical protein F5Y06DRAFT_277344 [Hypoxylon sp. FL0890]
MLVSSYLLQFSSICITNILSITPTAPTVEIENCSSTLDNCSMQQLNHVEDIDWHELRRWTMWSRTPPALSNPY